MGSDQLIKHNHSKDEEITGHCDCLSVGFPTSRPGVKCKKFIWEVK